MSAHFESIQIKKQHELENTYWTRRISPFRYAWAMERMIADSCENPIRILIQSFYNTKRKN